MKKIACGIVFYNPTEEDIIHLKKYIDIFDKIIIYDNSNFNNYDKLEKNEKILYLYNGKNDGLSKAYNKFLEYSINEKIDFICTLDQDSKFEVSEINIMLDYIYKNNMDEIGILCPLVIYKNSKTKLLQLKENTSYINWCISSGSFLNIKIFNDEKIKFDENYFIDRVDIDICKIILNKNKKILRLNSAKLFQNLGKTNELGFTEHSYERHYYIFRNRLYFNSKYYKCLKKSILNILQSIKHIILILVCEEKKIKKVMKCLEGLNDYKKRKFGNKKIYEK